MDLPQVIREILQAREPKAIADKEKGYHHAGVLIPLFSHGGVCKLLLTKRTHQVYNHKGQISFPGGAVDDGDRSFEDTALRETEEEIGLRKGDVEVLGKTDDTLTLVSNFVIHPYVGFFEFPYDFELNPFEVEKVIQVPIEVFAPGRERTKRIESEYNGKTYRSPAYVYGDEVIWGATARVIEDFIGIITRKLDLKALAF